MRIFFGLQSIASLRISNGIGLLYGRLYRNGILTFRFEVSGHVSEAISRQCLILF